MSKWQEILNKAKSERAPLQKQANEIQTKLYRLDGEIFRAEEALRKEKGE